MVLVRSTPDPSGSRWRRNYLAVRCGKPAVGATASSRRIANFVRESSSEHRRRFLTVSPVREIYKARVGILPSTYGPLPCQRAEWRRRSPRSRAEQLLARKMTHTAKGSTARLMSYMHLSNGIRPVSHTVHLTIPIPDQYYLGDQCRTDHRDCIPIVSLSAWLAVGGQWTCFGSVGVCRRLVVLLGGRHVVVAVVRGNYGFGVLPAGRCDVGRLGVAASPSVVAGGGCGNSGRARC